MSILSPSTNDSKWLKSAVIGSVWGANEIIIGSFFHNINMPLTGTFLAMIGVVLLVAMHRIWKDNGLFWRAGLICAVMKSVSPSSIILLPMIGIMTEALLLELSVRLLGKNPVAYFIGGALAVLSTLFYRIIGFIVFYGFNIVDLFLNIYQYAVKQLKIESFGPWELVILLVVIYAMLGVIAAYLGLRIAKNALRLSGSDNAAVATQVFNESFFEVNHKQRYSKYFAIGHALILITGMITLGLMPVWLNITVVAVYTLICIPLYRHALKRLAKPMIWVQLLIILLLATVFLGPSSEPGEYFNVKGLMAGLYMNLRALFVIISFTALGIELRNPFIKGIILNRRYAKIYLSIELAFEILPATLDRLSKPREFFRNPFQSFLQLVRQSEQLLETLQNKVIEPPRLFFITGEVGQGKTTLLKNIINRLHENQFRTAGFIAEGFWNNGMRAGFDLHNIRTGETLIFCREYNTDGYFKLGRFYFNPVAVETGSRWLFDPEETPDIAVIDEIGRFEVEGHLWAPALSRLLQLDGIIILVVRKKFIQSIINKWHLKNVSILDVGRTNPDDAYRIIEHSIRHFSNKPS